VVAVRSDQAVARQMEGHPRNPIQVGDQVTSSLKTIRR